MDCLVGLLCHELRHSPCVQEQHQHRTSSPQEGRTASARQEQQLRGSQVPSRAQQEVGARHAAVLHGLMTPVTTWSPASKELMVVLAACW